MIKSVEILLRTMYGIIKYLAYQVFALVSAFCWIMFIMAVINPDIEGTVDFTTVERYKIGIFAVLFNIGLYIALRNVGEDE